MTQRRSRWALNHSSHSALHAIEMTFHAIRDNHSRLPGCDRARSICIHQPSGQTLFFDDSDEALAERLRSEAFLVNREYIERFVQEALLQAEALNRVADSANLVTRSDGAAVAVWFDDYFLAMSRLLSYYQFPSKPGGEQIIAKIRVQSQHHSPVPSDLVEVMLSSDLRATAWFKEKQARLNLYRFLDKDKYMFMEHAERYIKNFRFISPILHRDDTIENLLVNLKSDSDNNVTDLEMKIHQISTQSEYANIASESLFDILSVDEEHRIAIRSLSDLGVLRLLLREAMHFAGWNWRQLRSVIPDLITSSLSPGDIIKCIRLMLHHELIECLVTGRIAPSLLQDVEMRAQVCIQEMATQAQPLISTRIIAGSDAIDRLNAIDLCLNRNQAPAVEKVYGTPVTAPVVRAARVLIIDDSRSIDSSACTDRIIVVDSLRPRMVPACRSAAAIIAEDGSITSHASVLAREAGIPCIVGVHDARAKLRHASWVGISTASGKVLPLPEERALLLRSRSVAITPRPTPPATSILPVPHTPTATSEASQAMEVLWLTESGHNESLIGGKARGLVELGPYTPPGFVVTTTVTERALRLPLSQRIDYLEHILEGTHTQLSSKFVVVRSSHSWEDTSAHSLAGLLHSELMIANQTDQIARAINRILESAMSIEKAGDYQDFDPNGTACIIQAAISPDWSGTIWTGHRHRQKQWVTLEYVPGHLASLLQGQVLPLRSFCPRDTWDSTDSRALQHVFLPPIYAESVRSVLPDLSQLLTMHKMDWGNDVELEWAVANGVLSVFQVRTGVGARIIERGQGSHRSPSQ